MGDFRRNLAGKLYGWTPLPPDMGPPLPHRYFIMWPEWTKGKEPGVVTKVGRFYEKSKISASCLIAGEPIPKEYMFEGWPYTWEDHI